MGMISVFDRYNTLRVFRDLESIDSKRKAGEVIPLRLC
jgi:hypothetical protein